MFEFVKEIPPQILDAVGVMGFGLYVLNYVLLTIQKVGSEQIRYFVMNWLAASMVLIGLIGAFNLASVLIQVSWIAISTVGIIIRCRRAYKATPTFESRRIA